MNEPNEQQATTPTPTPSVEESLSKIAAELAAIHADLDNVSMYCSLSITRRGLNPLY